MTKPNEEMVYCIYVFESRAQYIPLAWRKLWAEPINEFGRVRLSNAAAVIGLTAKRPKPRDLKKVFAEWNQTGYASLKNRVFAPVRGFYGG